MTLKYNVVFKLLSLLFCAAFQADKHSCVLCSWQFLLLLFDQIEFQFDLGIFHLFLMVSVYAVCQQSK